MRDRYIGLDIGTSAVRAAELRVARDRYELVQFGQLSLPEGAVVEGEIVDAAAVAQVLAELWESVGFSHRNVVVGINSQRLVVRTFSVPVLEDESELDSTVRFEALEQIPIPLDEAVIDFEVIGRVAPTSEDDEEMLRVLVAAVPMDLVQGYLDVAALAKLQIDALDPVPFALVRASAPESHLAPFGLEAVVNIGSSLTSVVVQRDGKPQFVRILRVGTSSLREALMAGHDVELEMAESIKRAVSGGDISKVDPEIVDTLNRAISPLVDEIRGSIDFYSAQSDVNDLERVSLSGGGSRVKGISERLKRELNVPVDMAHPLLTIDVAKEIGFDPETLSYLEPVMVSVVGAGYWSIPVHKGERKINLLPERNRVSSKQKRQKFLMAISLIACVSILGMGWLYQQMNEAKVRNEIASTQSTVNRLNADSARLSHVSDLLAQQQQGLKTETQILGTDVSWTRMMRELAAVMPGNVTLQTFEVQKASPMNLSIQGTAKNENDIADWLTNLKKLSWVTDAWVASTVKKPDDGTFSFSSTVSVNPAGESNRQSTRLSGLSQ